jgi:hypothetical protein
MTAAEKKTAKDMK